MKMGSMQRVVIKERLKALGFEPDVIPLPDGGIRGMSRQLLASSMPFVLRHVVSKGVLPASAVLSVSLTDSDMVVIREVDGAYIEGPVPVCSQHGAQMLTEILSCSLLAQASVTEGAAC